MRSFKSYDKSNVTFKFFFTGLVALSLLLVIGVVFFVWYYVRKRNEEKQRHSQHIEDTFSERLANRGVVAGKNCSKIDVGFASQQELNRDSQDGERRPTFSRFFKLWKGLRNSKRRAQNENEETAKTVVFTIPTEDVFPRTHARQQNYHQDAITQTDAFQTHLCEVHRVTHDVIEDYSNDKLHDLVEVENETCQVEAATESSNSESGNTKNGEMIAIVVVGERTEQQARKTSEEKHLQGKDEGKSFSKESDVDSGCGSSCHEIYATDPTITHAQLSVSSLIYCHAQRAEEAIEGEFLGKNPAGFFESKGVESKAEFVNELCSSLDSGSSEPQAVKKSGDETDTFEELIQLAKDGMSTLARKRVDNSGKKNKSSDCLQANTSGLLHPDDQNTATDKDDEARDRLDASLKSSLDSDVCPDPTQVDDGIKCATSTSLSLGDYAKAVKDLQFKAIEKQFDASPALGNAPSYATTSTNNSNAEGSHLGASTNELLHPTTRVCKATNSGVYHHEIPTITFDSESETVSNSLETAAEHRVGDCLTEPQITVRQEDSNKLVKEDCDRPAECNSKDTQKAEAFEKRQHLPLRIQDSLLNSANVIIEKTDRPRSMILPSHIEDKSVDKPMYGMKVPSLETLQLPFHGQTKDSADTGRIRSFSATIRRKLSFRDRISSDDLDLEKQCSVDDKNKKLKGFRSFRINRKKKTKGLKKDDISHSAGCLSDSKKYLSTIDKIFHENTGSALFTDVPFTIPEISEQ